MKCRFADRKGFEAWIEVSPDYPPSIRIPVPSKYGALPFRALNTAPLEMLETLDFERHHIYGNPGCTPSEFVYVESGARLPSSLSPSPEQVRRLVEAARALLRLPDPKIGRRGLELALAPFGGVDVDDLDPT